MENTDVPNMTCVRLNPPYESRVEAGWLLGRPEAALLVPVEGSIREPKGDPALTPQRTIVACAWSDTHLHVAFHCEDTDAWSTFARRDDPLYEEEVVEVFLSTTGDLRRYFELELSPRNVLFDAAVYSPDLHRATMSVDTGWNATGVDTDVVTPHPVHATPSGERTNTLSSGGWWQAVFHIPFAALGVSAPAAGDVWRANFYRIDRPAPPAEAEYTAWSPTGETPPNFHVPSRFGRLLFGAR